MLVKFVIFIFLFFILVQLFEQVPLLVEGFSKKKSIKPKSKTKANDIKNEADLQLKRMKDKMQNEMETRLSKLERDIQNNYITKDEFEEFKDENEI